MKAVYKYEVKNGFITLPSMYNLVSVGLQRGIVHIWAEVDVNPEIKDKSRVPIHVLATGQDIPEDSVHIGTVFPDPFVWHIYKGLRGSINAPR